MNLSKEPKTKQEAVDRAKYWFNEAWNKRKSMGVGGMDAYRECMSKYYKYKRIANRLPYKRENR